MFDWIKNLFYSKDFDGYSKNEKLKNSNSISTSINKTITPPTAPLPTTPTTSQTTIPIVFGPKGQTGISGSSGLQGQPGFTGSSSPIGTGWIICTEEGCHVIFKPVTKNQKRCDSCTQKNRENQIKKLLE